VIVAYAISAVLIVLVLVAVGVMYKRTLETMEQDDEPQH
jgi:hypothetical protein